MDIYLFHLLKITVLLFPLTPFSLILIYEVYLLLFYLPRSFTSCVVKQFEIISLIVIRKIFKDIPTINLDVNWYRSEQNLQLLTDLIGFLVLFLLIYWFYSGKKMGNMKDLMGMIPGMGKMMKDVDIDDDAFKYIEAMIGSMTPRERSNPKLMNHSRKMRIAKGSGTDMQQVNQLLKQFAQMNKMMRMVQGGKGRHIMQQLQGLK